MYATSCTCIWLYRNVIVLYMQIRREAQYVLEGYKYGYDFDNVKEKLDVLYGQVHTQIQLEANSSKKIKDILEKLTTDEGKQI